jgi:Tfp pilus assembly protein PilW
MATRRLFDGAQIELELLPIVGSGLTSYNLSLSKGNFTLSGKDATLTFSAGSVSYSITASKGTYSLSGKVADFKVGRTLSSEKGVYTLTGKNADFKVGRTLSASSGNFTLTGSNVTLILSGAATDYSLTANKGAYNLTGKNVSLKTNFLVVYHYVSPNFNLYRLRVYTSGTWENVALYKYKNSNWHEFTK